MWDSKSYFRDYMRRRREEIRIREGREKRQYSSGYYIPIFTEYQRGWLEGLIDGEGCLCMSQNGKETIFTFGLSIQLTDRRILEKVKEIVCVGTIREKGRKTGAGKTVYNIVFYQNMLRQILPQIRLVSKEKQRLLMLEALGLVGNSGGRPNPNLVRLKEIRQLLHEANA